MKESNFQSSVIKEIESRFPGSIVVKNDPNYIQGFPDLTIFHNERWATLECKKDKDADHQPNQDYYVEKMSDMSFSSFIYPENRKDVLNELGLFFER